MSMKLTWLLYSFLGVVLVKHKTLQFFFSSSCPENLKKVVGVGSLAVMKFVKVESQSPLVPFVSRKRWPG